MRKLNLAVLLASTFVICLMITTAPSGGTQAAAAQDALASSRYVVIAWNDLGMHCISPTFDQMAILPPFNNLQAQVIRRGDPPTIVTSGVTLRYSIKKNTTVAGKTDFWDYVQPLFGVDLPLGVGLTGNGLAGTMQMVGDRFEARGIPTVPLDDRMRWYPYQKGVVKAFDGSGALLAKTTATIPVSDELHCDRCHAAGGIGAPGIDTGRIESNILTIHDRRVGTDLTANMPVLCASCHADNALGTPGQPGVSSLSLAMHGKHASLGANAPGCYDCHPGDRTQCLRTALEGMGPSGADPRCERCHGTLQNVATSIEAGRRPWLEEPTCAQCHGTGFATNEPLYRNSQGHGRVFCAACHNSPHAWYPSQLTLDNKQPMALQGSRGPIGDERNCTVCHLSSPSGSIHTGGGD
jgi:hypothetical protein